jgi:hypothetical protein
MQMKHFLSDIEKKKININVIYNFDMNLEKNLVI